MFFSIILKECTRVLFIKVIMCLSIPPIYAPFKVGCEKQQLCILRCADSGEYVVTYRTVISADAKVKSFAFTVESGLISRISKEALVPCLSEYLEPQIVYRSLGVSMEVTKRDDGSFVLGFKLSDLTADELSQPEKVAVKCLEAVLESDSNDALKSLFGDSFVKPTTADDISDLVTTDEGVMEFFGELIEALLGVWKPGDDLILVIPHKSMEESDEDPYYRVFKKSRQEMSVKVTLVFRLPNDASSFPVMGMQHNHDEVSNPHQKENYYVITNVNNLCMPLEGLKHTLFNFDGGSLYDDLGSKYNIRIDIGSLCAYDFMKGDCKGVNSICLK